MLRQRLILLADMYGASSSHDSSLNGRSYSSLNLFDSLSTFEDEQTSLNTLDRLAADKQNEELAEEVPSMTLTITNVVCMANMRCHLRLKELARSSVNVEYKALQNHVIMRLRRPYTVATIWSSGKIWCTGANSLANAKQGARRIARRISQVGFPCRFSKYRIVNIMATCRLPFRVRLEDLVKARPKLMSYEPELAPGLNFKTHKDSSTSLKLFSTGRVVIMGSSLDSIGNLVEELIPLAALHQTDEPLSDSEEDVCSGTTDRNRQRRHYYRRRRAGGGSHHKNPFAEIAAHDIPALADVLLEDEDDAFAEAEEEAADAACTDNDSEEDDNNEQITKSKPQQTSFTSVNPQFVTQLTWPQQLQSQAPSVVDIVRSGSTKRACITAYSEQQISSAAVPVPLPASTPHCIFAPTTSNVSATAVVPMRFATTSLNSTVQPQIAALGVSSQPKVVTINPPTHANILRVVSPMQIATTTNPQQPRYILSRFPTGATIISPAAATFVMAPSAIQFTPAGGNSQTQVITTATTISNATQQTPLPSTFVAPEYR